MNDCYVCYNTGSDSNCPCRPESKDGDFTLFRVPVDLYFHRELNPDEVMRLVKRLDEVARELFEDDYDGWGLNVAEVRRQL